MCSGLGLLFCPFTDEAREVKSYGNWNRQVVQQREGLRVHHTGRRWQGSVRALQRDPGGWVQVAPGRRERGVRASAGREGPAGRERRGRRVSRALFGGGSGGPDRRLKLSGGGMARRSPQTLGKREREQAKLEKRQRKQQKKAAPP